MSYKALQVPPTFQYPFILCTATTLATYVLSIITGNVSQVDRLWTFLPTIYTAYWALLPLWPYENEVPMYLIPHVPLDVDRDLVEEFSPRALLMLGLSVSVHVHEFGPSDKATCIELIVAVPVDVQIVLQHVETWAVPAVR
jgi:hypothetical protein